MAPVDPLHPPSWSQRPDLESEPVDAPVIGDVERPLTFFEQLTNSDAVRRVAILVALGAIWELYARWIDNPLILPTLSSTLVTFARDVRTGVLVDRVMTSLRSLVLGYVVGLVLAAVFTTLAVSTRVGSDLLSMLTAMFNPIPAIALLPLALIWFGLGTPSLVLVIVHSVLWAVALNALSGFRSVPETLRMSGRNYGLRGVRYVAFVLMPAAFPSILTGLKIGWAFAWRTLIAAELVFGVSSRSGGLGWYIFEARAELETSRVFAGLLALVLIGLTVEAGIFRFIEARTVVRWGMQR
jgi:NitT/TauT family transport system permease protein